MKKQQITVRVPATTSNLGPGFDCLGIALQIYNFITIAHASAPGGKGMARQAARQFFDAVGCEPFPFSCTIVGEVPPSRGLGSSVTVRLGVLHALNAMLDRPLKRSQIFGLCAELEGHPDNAAPAEFGGFVVARHNRHQRFPVDPRLRFVLLIPSFEVRTNEARRVLPNEISRLGAIESCGNACLITAAMASGDYEALRGAWGDHLHQPFRAEFVPFLDRVIAAAEQAGALGGFLSGSGSTIAAATLHAPEAIAAAMLRASGLTAAETRIVGADNDGVRIVVSILAPDASLA
ncbi:MAG TPA: homoserine kinase [Chthoniobacterales bacterium]|nr:homoserine kinase [Chthoniobacterales bacterium]